MNIVKFISRPQTRNATRWTGGNKPELESYYSEIFNTPVTFSVDGTELVRDGWPFTDTGNVPEGHWFSHDSMGSTANEDFIATSQIISGEGPFKYGISED